MNNYTEPFVCLSKSGLDGILCLHVLKPMYSLQYRYIIQYKDNNVWHFCHTLNTDYRLPY